MKIRCITLALIGFMPLAYAADITGKITLQGTPPAEIQIPFDPACSRVRTDKATTRHYVVGPGGELADVFVYIKEGLNGKTYPPPSEPVVLDQVGCLYSPYVFGIQTGQKLIIKNSDRGVLHNVHVTPDPKSGNKESNQAQLTGQQIVKTFDHPEVLLRFKCDVHQWMYSYAGVLDHPFFAVTGTDGTFKIANVPPGKYVIEAYHRKAGKLTKEVTVGDQNVTADFTMQVSK